MGGSACRSNKPHVSVRSSFARNPVSTVIVQLIGSTKTATGLQIRAELDENNYPTKEIVTSAQLANVRLIPAASRGEWNYAIMPH
ncbi:MAG: hypothetical protein HOP29_20115 [Phycisphaerales bacterium]|nr:hypothetical protein [Phycisphaerales bacterium]